MSYILGLDPCLFLKNKTVFSEDDKHLTVSFLSEVFEEAKDNNVKYLYNGYYDNHLPNSVINVFNEIENDIAYIALSLTSPFEYFEKVYEFNESNQPSLFSFSDQMIKGYIYSTFIYLFEKFNHGIVKSNRRDLVNLSGNQYHFINDIDIFSSLEIEYLPKVNDLNDFYNYFNDYDWFLGKNKKEFILTDNFKTQITRLDDSEYLRVLTSLLRGVYFPDFMNSQGTENCRYTITTHSDRSVRQMKIGNNFTTLYRIHSVELNQNSGGLNRICYTIFNEIVIVFFYHDDHCDTLSHEEIVYIDGCSYKLVASK